MKNISVSEAVLNTVRAKGPMTTKGLVTTIKKPANQIYTAVWKLVQTGKLNKWGKVVQLANAPAMTAIKPDLTVTVDSSDLPIDSAKRLSEAVSKRKATPFEMKLASKLNKAEEEIAVLRRDLTQMSVNYYDAMAVIKYLESKTKA